jgi:translation initiation factor eIF-2B subunit epsilon
MEEADPRQAVVLCDSFETRFGPLSVKAPKALFPVGSEPLIRRVLQFLDTAGVKRAILLCTAGSGDDVIRSVAEQYGRHASMKVEVVAAGSCLTLGDALRDLDSRKLITRHDFLLIRGDVLGSLDMLSLLTAHKENFKRDKGALMTMVMTPRSFESATRREDIHDDVFVTDRKTGKLLHRQDLSSNPKFEFSTEFHDVDVRNDLQESGVYICGPGVPPAFSDNFDFQTMDDFVKGILDSEEILGSSLYLYIASREDEFVCRLDSVSSWNKGFEDLCNRRALRGAFGDHMEFWNVYRSPSSKVDS